MGQVHAEHCTKAFIHPVFAQTKGTPWDSVKSDRDASCDDEVVSVVPKAVDDRLVEH